MSHVTCHMSNVSEKGFTLIEVLIAMAILVIILSLGLFISFDFYKSYAFRSEKNIVVSVLQKARSESLNNINQTRHGVHFEASPSLKYILFECPAASPQCTYYNTGSSTDIIIDSSYGASIANPLPLPFDVIFGQLSGDCIPSSGATPFACDSLNQPITISYGARSYNITVNSEGRIDWQ